MALGRKKVKEQVKAIMESKTLAEAYKKTHNCSDSTAEAHGYRMLKNPEIAAELEKQLSLAKPIDVNKNNLIKLLTMVVQSWQQGEEKTADFLRAIELLSRLVPEFSEKHAFGQFENMSDEEINKQLIERLRTLGN